MNIVGCLDRPTSGTYELAGEDVLSLNENKLADVRLNQIGFVFQNFQLLPRMTALDNVALPLVYAGVRKKGPQRAGAGSTDSRRAGGAVSFTPTQLSGGQKQRVAIARAMVNSRRFCWQMSRPELWIPSQVHRLWICLPS